jgi:peptide methionine sulfoxide reductase MsrB
MAMSDKIRKSDADWRAQLDENQYHVTRKGGTEPPFTGEYEDTETQGRTRVCAADSLYLVPTRSFIPGRAGQAIPSQSQQTTWKCIAIPVMEWLAQR